MPPKESISSRKRAYHPKSRTGCWSCRSRKVKCDEGKPACQRCRNYGMRCAGYAPIRPIVSAYQSLIKNLSDTKPCRTPSIPLMSSILQEQYFNLFRTKTINAIVPYFGPKRWENKISTIVMDACSTEPALFHALVALGALEKTCEVIRIDKDSAFSTINPHHEFALKEYGKAIKKLRKGAEDGLQDLRIVLLTTIFIICFEELHGNYESSTAQIHIALKMIEEWKAKYDVDDKHGFGFSSPAPYEIPDIILQIFGRLEIQTMLFIDPRPVQTHAKLRSSGAETVESMPQAFTTREEARIYLDLVMRRLMHWIAQIGYKQPAEPSNKDLAAMQGSSPLSSSTSMPASDGRNPPPLVQFPKKQILDAPVRSESPLPRNSLESLELTETHGALQKPFRRVIPDLPYRVSRTSFSDDSSTRQKSTPPSNMLLSAEVYEEQDCCLSELLSWRASFDPLYIISSQDASRSDVVGFWLLKLHYLLSYITVRAKLSPSESTYDLFTAEFTEALSLCSSILSKLSSDTEASRSSLHFTFDHGVLIPLYITMTKCRVSALRKEALLLTQTHQRREGNWDSELAVAVGQWVMRTEEQGALSDGSIPEMARVSHINLKSHVEQRKALLCCQRWSSTEGRFILCMDTIAW